MTVKGFGGRLNKIPATGSDVMCMCFVKKGNRVLRKKVMSVAVICQRKSTHRKEGIFIYFEDRRSDREREGRDEGFGDHQTSESRTSR